MSKSQEPREKKGELFKMPKERTKHQKQVSTNTTNSNEVTWGGLHHLFLIIIIIFCRHRSFLSLFLPLLLSLHHLHRFLPLILILRVISVTCFSFLSASFVFCCSSLASHFASPCCSLFASSSSSFHLHCSLWPASSANSPPPSKSGTNSSYHTQPKGGKAPETKLLHLY